jgi:CMP-N-acetylneuraminic acid synthetase
VPFLRPKEIARDHAAPGEAIKYTLATLKGLGYVPDIFSVLFPTHPFRTITMLDFLVGKLLEGHRAVITVKQIHDSPFAYFQREADGTLTPLRFLKNQSEVHSEIYSRKYGTFFGNNHSGTKEPFIYVLTDPITQVDIDTFADLYFAESIIKNDLYRFSG